MLLKKISGIQSKVINLGRFPRFEEKHGEFIKPEIRLLTIST